MSLSVRSSARAGNPLGGGEDWGDSPYGSLITLGPKTFKKKPVLVLAAEELAEAHLAMAMGGAEIMELMPDPVEAPRPRQTAVILGLVPMGADAPIAPPVAYVPPPVATDFDDEDDVVWEPLPDYDEPETEEAEVQTWMPEDEPDELVQDPSLAAEDWDELPTQEAMFAAPEPQVPSIEEQLERMRDRLARRAAATAAPDPAPQPAPPAAAEERIPTIERLEIDDWSSSASLKGFNPPQEQDLPPAPLPVAASAAVPAAPPSVRAEPVTPPSPVVAQPEPTPVMSVPVVTAPEPVDEPYEPELPSVLPDDDLSALDAWAEHLEPVAPPARRYGGIRARLSDSEDWQGAADEPAPSLLARLWGWLRGRF
jgi:hypothetical protein